MCSSDLLKPGVAMREATARIEHFLRANAAEDVRIMVAAGEQAGVSLRPADDRALRAGDSVLLYVAAEAQRYWAEGARTYVLGAASEAQKRLVAQAEQALTMMRANMALGAGAATIAKMGEMTLTDAALRASARGYGLGNGIGLDAAQAPVYDSRQPVNNR